MIVLETDRLIIRESSGRDFSRIYSMMLSESRKITIRDIVTDDENEELEKYLAYIHTVYSVFGFGLWSVCLKKPEEYAAYPGVTGPEELPEEDLVIGRCGFQPIADERSPLGRIELGYLIEERWRRQGFAFEACAAILQYGFERLKIDEVYAQIPRTNIPSLMLAEKLGFKKMTGSLWILKNTLPLIKD